MKKKQAKRQSPRILFFDIETAPITAYIWGLFDLNVGLNQIKKDWFVLSWSAKWADSDQIMYADQRKARNLNNEKRILKQIWSLLDEADIVVTQNGIRFDSKKLNARFIAHGMQKPSTYKHIDTLRIAKRHFSFTSNKLEYLGHVLNTKVKKLSRRKFEGFELWRECLAGNQEAWKEMEIYNKRDVLTLEQVYYKLVPWENSINFALYSDELGHVCSCGSTSFLKRGFIYTATGKFQRYRCNKCGAESRDSKNLFDKPKRESLRKQTR